MITILFFASFRERLGVASERLSLNGPTNVGSVLTNLRNRGGIWHETFAEGQTVMMAVNQEIADTSTTVNDGDELAFFPPVTGG
jgi:molybdopterin synthase sulfur carrier subunit